MVLDIIVKFWGHTFVSVYLAFCVYFGQTHTDVIIQLYFGLFINYVTKTLKFSTSWQLRKIITHTITYSGNKQT